MSEGLRLRPPADKRTSNPSNGKVRVGASVSDETYLKLVKYRKEHELSSTEAVKILLTEALDKLYSKGL